MLVLSERDMIYTSHQYFHFNIKWVRLINLSIGLYIIHALNTSRSQSKHCPANLIIYAEKIDIIKSKHLFAIQFVVLHKLISFKRNTILRPNWRFCFGGDGGGCITYWQYSADTMFNNIFFYNIIIHFAINVRLYT